MATESIGEIEVLTIVSETLEKLEDKAAAERVVRWAWDKYIGKSEAMQPATTARRGVIPKSKAKGGSAGKKETLSVVKDLNLKPDGALSLAEFVKEKQPSSIKAKIAVCVYYLSTYASVSRITIHHIYTSFKWLTWRLPTDLKNMVYQVGSQGRLDTSDINNVRLTTMGENFVEHDLPKASKAT